MSWRICCIQIIVRIFTLFWPFTCRIGTKEKSNWILKLCRDCNFPLRKMAFCIRLRSKRMWIRTQIWHRRFRSSTVTAMYTTQSRWFHVREYKDIWIGRTVSNAAVPFIARLAFSGALAANNMDQKYLRLKINSRKRKISFGHYLCLPPYLTHDKLQSDYWRNRKKADGQMLLLLIPLPHIKNCDA